MVVVSTVTTSAAAASIAGIIEKPVTASAAAVKDEIILTVIFLKFIKSLLICNYLYLIELITVIIISCSQKVYNPFFADLVDKMNIS